MKLKRFNTSGNLFNANEYINFFNALSNTNANMGFANLPVIPNTKKGEYIVTLTIKTKSGQKAEKSEKIIISDPLSAPKAIIRTPRILRSPAGKADYRWAREVAESSLVEPAEPTSNT